jgi:hypothetical protein
MTMCCHEELTLSDVLSDPLIRTVNEADRIDRDAFELLLNDIARQREESAGAHHDRARTRRPWAPRSRFAFTF